jgi:hypothetical protein
MHRKTERRGNLLTGEGVREKPHHTTARKPVPLLTINVTVVYMARDVVVLIEENPFRGPKKGVSLEN